MKFLLTSFFFWLGITSLPFNLVETTQAADKKLDTSKLMILGLDIGDCTSQNIYAKLGPGIPFKEDADPDITQVCYVSDKDDTLILFSFKISQCSRFRLMAQKKKFHKWHFCEKSPLVSKHLATESGLKLGMSKCRMKAILGVPRNESAQTIGVVYVWAQKMTEAEIERAPQYSNEVKKIPHRRLKATIRAEFTDSKLISFDVSKISQ